LSYLRPEDSDPELGIINAHHIIDRKLMPNGGYVKNNGITVCDTNGSFPGGTSCHMIVEQWHITNGDEDKVAEKHRPKSLYSVIGSSHELAVKSSEELL